VPRSRSDRTSSQSRTASPVPKARYVHPCRRLALLLGLVLVAYALAGCGAGKPSAAEVERAQRELSPTAFADIHCAADRGSGWDYVCTYTTTTLGQRKLGIVVGAHGLMLGSGSVALNAPLPDGPHRHGRSRAAWVRLVNQVCAKRAGAVRRFATPHTQNELIDVGARIVSLEQLEVSRLAGIRAPEGGRGAVSGFVLSIGRVQRAIERFRTALMLRSPADLVSAKAELAHARRDANARARRLGLACRH
jgi:hypothetical protein